MTGKISEVFESIQGEGIYAGERQLFVRFFGCNLNCKYCDTRLSYFKEYTVDALFTELMRSSGSYHSVSFTGGEPLLQKDFLRNILRLTSEKGFKNYLETNGTLPESLETAIDYVDIVAMDFKLPSSGCTFGNWQDHELFLKIAAQKEVFIKAVICNSTKQDDLIMALTIIRRAALNIPFILQPNSNEIDSRLCLKVDAYKKICEEYLSDVRIIPQMHKMTGVR